MLIGTIMKQSPIYHNPKGPSVRATFTVAGDQLLGIALSLSESEGFEWNLLGADDHVKITHWVENYCEGKQPTTPLNWSLEKSSPFTRKVLEELSTVPFGHSFTYGEFAAGLGSPKAARAVGSACSRNPLLLVIPCHRIVASNGSLGGFAGGIEIKRRLLKFEKLA